MKELFRVQVAGHSVPVFRANSKEVRELENDDGTDLCGCFVPPKGTIYICQGLPKDVERDTINHEIVHAWFYLSGAREVLRRLVKRPDDTEDVEETLVSVLTPHVRSIDWCK